MKITREFIQVNPDILRHLSLYVVLSRTRCHSSYEKTLHKSGHIQEHIQEFRCAVMLIKVTTRRFPAVGQ